MLAAKAAELKIHHISAGVRTLAFFFHGWGLLECSEIDEGQSNLEPLDV